MKLLNNIVLLCVTGMFASTSIALDCGNGILLVELEDQMVNPFIDDPDYIEVDSSVVVGERKCDLIANALLNGGGRCVFTDGNRYVCDRRTDEAAETPAGNFVNHDQTIVNFDAAESSLTNCLTQIGEFERTTFTVPVEHRLATNFTSEMGSVKIENSACSFNGDLAYSQTEISVFYEAIECQIDSGCFVIDKTIIDISEKSEDPCDFNCNMVPMTDDDPWWYN